MQSGHVTTYVTHEEITDAVNINAVHGSLQSAGEVEFIACRSKRKFPIAALRAWLQNNLSVSNMPDIVMPVLDLCSACIFG